MFKLDSLGKIIIEPELLLIPEFNKIWTNDKSRDKSDAYKKLTYIYFMCDYKSPYNNYGEKKEQFILKDYFSNKSFDSKDPDILSAISKYDELKKIPEIHVLDAMRGTLFKLSSYLSTAEVNNRSVVIIQKTMDTIAKTLGSYSTVKENVEKELGKQGRKRGGGQKGNRED